MDAPAGNSGSIRWLVALLFFSAAGIPDAMAQDLGSISGHVHRPGGDPAAGVAVTAITTTWEFGGSNTVQDDGSYAIGDLPTGTYRLCVGGLSDGVLRQCYDHFNATSPLSQPAYSPIALAVAQHVGDIDFDLARGGTIAGHITDGYSSESFSGLNMGFRIYAEDGEYLDTIDLTTDEAGNYAASGFPDGRYYLLVSAYTIPASDASQVYGSGPCPTNGCDPMQGTPIVIAEGNTRVGIDFTFHPSAVVIGHVRDAGNQQPIANALVTSYVPHSSPFGTTWSEEMTARTDTSGAYQLYTGSDRRFSVQVDAPYVNSVYPNIPCTVVWNCVQQAESVPIPQGGTKTLDFAITRGVALRGRIVTAAHIPLDGNFAIGIKHADGTYSDQPYTDTAGNFVSRGWPTSASDTYYVKVTSWRPFGCFYYLNRVCSADYDPMNSMATPIHLSPGMNEIEIPVLTDDIFFDLFDR